ncbi:MAG TPA: MBL fold metallo-hydrolase [Arenimonas sp.]|nr:MBL fold metallo-hydrolase [Arenimonas sp.]
MKAWSLLGNSQKLDGGAMFGNAPKAIWQQWVTVDEQNRIDLACRALLVENINGKRVLFETGVGAFFEPKMRERFGIQESEHVLLSELAKLGLSDADIDVVVLSHLHFDHAGGLLAAWQEATAPRLLFPNAKYVTGAAGWQRANNPHPRDRASFLPELNALLEASGRLELVNGEFSESLGSAVRFHHSDGHTPGLLLAEIIGNSEHVVFCADLIPGRAWVHLPITMGYDRFPELVIDEKKTFLADMQARNVTLFFTHDAECATAHLSCDAKGKYSTTDEQADWLAHVL